MDWKKTGKKLLFPPVWLMVLLTVASAALLIWVFVQGWEQTAMAYMVYVLAFYALGVVSIFFAMVLPKRYRHIRQKIYSNPLGKRYMTDPAFRTGISLTLSLVINLLYAGVNIFIGFLSHSAWFGILAGYYVVLSVMRFLLMGYTRKVGIGNNQLQELKKSRLCACFLLLVNLSLSGAVLMMVYQSRGYDYPGILIYVAALYTFYMTTHAIVGLIKYRSLGSPVISTAKSISLASALVSMLNLETAMFAQFGGEMAPEHQNLMIMLTGAGISTVVIAMSVLIILWTNRQIKAHCAKK